MAGKGKFSLEAIFSAVDKLSAPLAKIKTKLTGFGKAAGGAMRSANSAVDKGLAGMGKLSNAIGVGAVVSVAGLGLALKDTITEGANFERTMVFAAAQFPGMIKQGTKEFEELKKSAIAVGDATEFSAQDAAEGLTLLATAGLSAKAAIAALPKVVNFATASKVEFARASDIANDSMGAFGLKSQNVAKNAANMGRVMDVLTRAAADSTTNVEELFDAVKTGGPIAKTAGASLETFISYTEVLASVGIKGAESGTALRNMFLELGSPSTAAAKGMKALGVSVAHTKTGAIDMTATLARFSKATGKMTKAQKIAALGNVFGARTIGPFIALMDAGVDVIGEFEKSLKNAGGTTEGMANELQGDTLGAFRQFDSLISGLKLDVFFAIKPVVLDLVKATSDWVKENRELIKTKAGEWIVALRDNLPKIWEWTVKLAKAFAGFLVFAATVKAINVAILAYEVATKLAAAVTWLWNAAVDANILATGLACVETVALKVAQWATQAATVAVTAATWLYEAAIWAGQIGTAEFTFAQVASKVAQWASQAATVAVTAATWLYEAAVWAVQLATTEFTFATVAAKLAQWASTAATWLANAAQTAYALVVGASSGALGLFTGVAWSSVTAIGAQAAALAPFLITVGALTAAVLALYAAWNQWQKLDASLSGSGGITGTVGKMIDMGTFDPFKAHDAAMTDKARADRDAREKPQIVTPGARAASEASAAGAGASGTVDGKIVVEAKPGTQAQVKAKPRSVKLNLQPSGAF